MTFIRNTNMHQSVYVFGGIDLGFYRLVGLCG